MRDADGRVVAEHRSDVGLPSASVGKLLLLAEVAHRLDGDGSLSSSELLERRPDLAVAGTGLWRHLHVEQLSVEDLAVLVSSVSDNLATNVLLEKVGLENVKALADALGLVHTALHDRVRDERGPHHPPELSTGAAAELSWFMHRVGRGELVSARVSERLHRWLGRNVDISLVASAFSLDPLARGAGGGLTLSNKTGSVDGIRADVGILQSPASSASYAVIANWQPQDAAALHAALSGMRDIGEGVRKLLT